MFIVGSTSSISLRSDIIKLIMKILKTLDQHELNWIPRIDEIIMHLNETL